MKNKSYMENKRHHLKMIQGVINRMAGNLFFLKGWTITLVGGLFALAAKDANSKYILVTFLPVLLFWGLDGYFLSQERLFRALYDHVRQLKESEIDFSMDTSQYRSDDRNSWPYSLFAATLLYFYLSLILIMLIIMFLIK